MCVTTASVAVQEETNKNNLHVQCRIHCNTYI
jgi:hypothetical protein